MNIIVSKKRFVSKKLRSSFRTFFYKYLYGQEFLPSKHFEKIVLSWESKYNTGDNPISKETWNSAYSDYKWKFMEELGDLSRYSILIGYMSYLKPSGSILDVGCGEGILFQKYRIYGYTKYVGIDISDSAIQKLTDYIDSATYFIAIDAENFQPGEKFDIIVFNESLYYLKDPCALVKRYSDKLEKEGFILVSTYLRSQRAMAILRQIKKEFALFDETRTIQGSRSWLCTVLVPKTAEAS